MLRSVTRSVFYIARKVGYRRGQGMALWNLSVVSEKLGDRSQAIAYAKDALEVYEQIEYNGAAVVREHLALWGQ